MDRRAGSLAPWPLIPSRPARSTPATAGRRLQEHGRGRDLERGQHRPARQCQRLRPGHRSPHAQHTLRGDRAAASSRARTRARPGTRPTPGCPTATVHAARHRSHHAQHALRRDDANGGVFKSTDGGGTWSAANTGLSSSPDVNALAIDPTTPSTLYAGTNGGGVFKSTDAGGTWSAANAGLPRASRLALAIDPTTPEHALRRDERRRRLQEHGRGRHLERGERRAAQHRRHRPRHRSPHAQTLYAGTTLRGTAAGVFKSTDAGATWSAANAGLGNFCPMAGVRLRPGHRSHHAPHTLRGDGRRRLQEHGRGRDLGRGQRRAAQCYSASPPWPSIPSRPARSTPGRAPVT